MTPGVRRSGDQYTFCCWAPACKQVELVLCADAAGAPRAGATLDDQAKPSGVSFLPMRSQSGYFTVNCDVPTGARYGYRLDGGGIFPDPASQYQPEGVHSLSAVPAHEFSWTDATFTPRSPDELVIYELHVGTFTSEGTFEAAAGRLSALADLGITCVELLPVSAFPGERNWGYDGVYPWAVQASYGGPDGLKRFVDAGHRAGITVLLDVVFNHLGPEGNYSRQFGPYFTDKYQTPWGEALNFDGPGSDGVREFFLGAVRNWLEQFHLDGFRLDAVHEIHDESGEPFLRQVSAVAEDVSKESGRRRIVIAESDLNERRLVEPTSRNGFDLDAAWADDFHHAVHVLLTGETRGYYQDYKSGGHLGRAVERGWSYAWDYSASRDRHHGSSPHGLYSSQFVFCTQNHDQVGNRMLGERLVELAGSSADRVARLLLLLAPAIPLLFMGQEYGERRPFLYFVDHTDEGLLAATREGRTREFEAFHDGSPPDPGSAETHARSILDWDRRTEGDELDLTRALLAVRRQFDCFGAREAVHSRSATETEGVVVLGSSGGVGAGIVVANLSGTSRTVDWARVANAVIENQPEGEWREAIRLGDVALADSTATVGPFSAAAVVNGYPYQESVQFPN